MGATRGVPIERLLAHREWVRALARTLVRDADGADDLEQQVWVEAVERPPADDRALRGWFGTVVRRRARDAWRAATRRTRHEAGAPPALPGRPTADLVAEAEAQRRVVDALLALDEPHREVLLLRYFEDLTPAAIALRLGAPRETVKTRLRRALGLLRQRLSDGGRREDWRPALVPLAVPPDSPAESCVTAAGGAIVGTAAKVALACGVLGAAGLSWWLLGSGAGPAGQDATSPGAPASTRGLEDRISRGEASPPTGTSARGPSPASPEKAEREDSSDPPTRVPRDRLPLVVAVEEPPPEGERIDLEVDAKGRVLVGPDELGMAALQARLREAAAAHREEGPTGPSAVTAVLRVDRDLSWQAAQWLMQACADPTVRIHRIAFAAAPDSGGVEGVLPTHLPKDDAELMKGPGEVFEEGESPPSTERERRSRSQPEKVILVKLTRAESGTPAAPRDLYPYLDRRFPDLRIGGFRGEIAADPRVPAGDVLAVVDAMRRAGMKSVVFRGTRILKEDSLEAALGQAPPPAEVLVITVLGESITPK
jgi:RNA polymerase sigma-70 factor (ECF subfamily)